MLSGIKTTPANTLMWSPSTDTLLGTVTQVTPRSSDTSSSLICPTGEMQEVSLVWTSELFDEMTLNSFNTGKPVMLTEYGADTVAGLHMEPSMVFTEEYQVRC